MQVLPHQPRSSLLEALPPEILIQICQNLCLHCCHPRIGEVRFKDAAIWLRDQSAIARLSACSRYLREIAQPVLFHFFHSLESLFLLRGRLAVFLRALCLRPDLAKSVKSLVLWSPFIVHQFGPVKPSFDDAAKDKDGLLKSVLKKLGPWWELQMKAGVDVLHSLALALAPQASYVLIQRRFDDPSLKTSWVHWPHPLDNLRHLVLPGWRDPDTAQRTYHLNEMVGLLRHTKNLESLVAIDCGIDNWRSSIGPQISLDSLPKDVELRFLKRISINGRRLGPEYVEFIIRHSTVLEDVEFYHNYYDRGWQPLELDKHFGAAKRTLRRLCYSALPIKERPKYSDRIEDLVGRRPFLEAKFQDGVTFSDFSALETLEVEQLFLYGPVFGRPDDMDNDRSLQLATTEDFLAKFPPSLKHLRLGCITHWPIVFRDVLEMAQQRTRFPELCSVQLEVLAKPPKEDLESLVVAFQCTGIAFSVLRTASNPSSRGLLPPRPGYPVPAVVSFTGGTWEVERQILWETREQP
jgi:hypothetical protein